MQTNITDLVRKSRWAPREAERDVVAAISSAEGNEDLSAETDGRRRGIGVALPLLALAAGVALGYGGSRWLGPLPWRRQLSPDPWQRVTDAARLILDAASKAHIPTWR